MNDRKKKKKKSQTEQLYEQEADFLNKMKKILDGPKTTWEELLQEYISLGVAYENLLRKSIKITRVGDTNQRRLLKANEKIEQQKEELHKAYKEVKKLARTDYLTKLSNRRDFLEKFQAEIYRFERSQAPFCVLMADIDNFTSVNNRYGHNCGDFVLARIAEIMKTTVRKQDVVARWGGEEFILLLTGAPLRGGQIVAEEIRKKIAAEVFTYEGINFSLTTTFGICEFDGSSDIDTCIKKADEALYKGKREGKNRVVLASRDND